MHLATTAAQQAALAAQQAAQQISTLVQEYQRGNRSAEPAQSAPTGGADPAADPRGAQSPNAPRQQSAPQQPDDGSSQRHESGGPPFVDVYESADAIVVFCDLPGVRADDIRLEGNEEQIRIMTERTPSETETDLTPVQQERYRRIERTIQLPGRVVVEQADATCEHGVCKVTLPKATQQDIGIRSEP